MVGRIRKLRFDIFNFGLNLGQLEFLGTLDTWKGVYWEVYSGQIL
jgi:hypothetical protein